jgi:CheY-like chemotaxis protein
VHSLFEVCKREEKMIHLFSFIEPESPLQLPNVVAPASATPCTNVAMKSALLVEKDKSLSGILRRRLKEEGYAVFLASNAEEALRLYRDFAPFRVVLIDYYVPQLDGIEIDCCAPQTQGIELAFAIRNIDPAQEVILVAFDFRNAHEVPRPPQAMQMPVLVELAQLRTLLERIELLRAVRALTRPEQLRLQQDAKFRIRMLGRAACGRDWQDLLSEAFSRTLTGATDTNNGRHWNKKVDLVRHLTETMRSIANSWRRQFNEEENTYLVSELQTCDAEGNEYSPVDNVASRHVPADERLIEQEMEDQILAILKGDPDATQVLKRWMDGFRKNEILRKCGLDEKRYDAAVRRIRMKLLGSRGEDNGI